MSRFIDNKRVLNIVTRLTSFEPGERVRIVTEIAPDKAGNLRNLGFSDNPADGDTVLPAVVGPTSRFNADGKWKVRRDLPKENRYIRTVLWRWKTWAGRYTEEHEDYRDLYRLCYPRELIAPPALELTYVLRQGAPALVVSPVFRNTPEEHENIRHAVNLFLELFKSCELTAADLGRRDDIPVRRVNWRLLPPGKYPWDRLEEHLDRFLVRKSEQVAAVIRDRQETIKGFGPAEVHVGLGGFREYMAYLFPALGVVVLESIQKDNAIYVFGNDWQRVSQLTKADVLAGNLHLARIIHSKGWKEQLARILDRGRAAE